MSVKVIVEQCGMEQLGPRLHRAIRSLVQDTVDLAYSKMRSKAPEKTGELKRSIRKKVNLSRLRAEVGPDVDYAVYVEYGTRPHTIHPVRAEALKFETGGEIVFTRVVRHPGTKASRFIRDSAEETAKEVERLWRERF